jgi:hypothetical protein
LLANILKNWHHITMHNETMSKFTRITSATKKTFETFRMAGYFVRGSRSKSAEPIAIDGRCISQSERFENPSKTFLSLPVRGTRRREAMWGTEGVTRFALPEYRGRVFGRDTKVCAPRIP